MIDLRGRRVVVTGGGRGIGAASAVLFARAGADVVVGFRSRRAEADAVALSDVAKRIGAPTMVEITEPLDAIPPGASPFAFRSSGPWA